ncbi:MAG: SRPBCC domain-containing protein [Pseudomonadota bacterium]
MADPIAVETHVPVPPERAWAAFIDAHTIKRWNFVLPHCCFPSAQMDLSKGGRRVVCMGAKDGSMGFDFEATHEEVEAEEAPKPSRCARHVTDPAS